MFVYFKFSTMKKQVHAYLYLLQNQFSVFYCRFHYVRPGFPKHALLVCRKQLCVISRACSEVD